MTRNALWDLIQRYMDDPGHRYRPTAADLARETGVSDQVISKWKKAATLPSVDQLTRFSRGTGIGYLELLAAALVGKGYLPDVADLQLDFATDDPMVAELLVEAGAQPSSNWSGTRLLGKSKTERGRPVTDLPTTLRKQMGLDDTEESDRDDRPAASKVPAPSPAEQLGKADYDLAAHDEDSTIEDEQHGE